MKRNRRVEFFIIKKCLNNCVFCSEHERFDGTEVAFSEIKKTLLEEKRKGTGLVHFMGGEPSIHSKFVDIISLAKKLGFSTHIITNCIRFSDPQFCKRALPYLDEIKVSIHGHNAKLHNANTRNKKSFKCLTEGLKNIRENYRGILMSTCSITRMNFEYMREIAEFIEQFSIRDLQFISIIPSGNGRRNFLDIIPRFSGLKAPINRVAEYCQKRNIRLRFAGVPMCILGKHYVLSSDLWEDFKVENKAEHDNTLQLWKEPHLPDQGFVIDIGRIKTGKCAGCAKKGVCGGIYQLYYQRYKDRELCPFNNTG